MHYVTGGGQSRAHSVGQCLHRRQVFRSAHAHADPHDNLGLAQRHFPHIMFVVFLQQRDIGVGKDGSLDRLDHNVRSAIRRHRGEHSGTKCDQIGQRLRTNRGDNIAAKGGFELHQLPVVVDLQINRIPSEPQLQPRRQSSRQVTAISGGGKEHGVWLGAVHLSRQGLTDGPTPYRAERCMVQDQNPISPVGGELSHQVFLRYPHQHCNDFTLRYSAQRPRFAQHLQRDGSDTTLSHLGHDPDAPLALVWIPFQDAGGGGISSLSLQRLQAFPDQGCDLLGGDIRIVLGDDHAQTVRCDETNLFHPGR